MDVFWFGGTYKSTYDHFEDFYLKSWTPSSGEVIYLVFILMKKSNSEKSSRFCSTGAYSGAVFWSTVPSSKTRTET